MSKKTNKQFGVWMDTHHATVVGMTDEAATEFTVLGHATNAGAGANSSEKNENNDARTLQHKYFKEILTHMQNAEEVHVTGTGIAQEQFMHFMADTPQFKNTVTAESTSNKMSDESLIAYITSKLN
jgi:stalled ribosome rescue protein Dom34